MHDTTVLAKIPRTHMAGALYDNAELFGGRVRLTAFGRFYRSYTEEEDWTFRHLQKPGDEKVDCSVTRHLPAIAQGLGVRELLVPSPVDFNGLMCMQRDLRVRIPIGPRLILRRGVRADGCRILPGQAYGVSSAGCCTIIAWYPDTKDIRPDDKIKVDVAHAGLLSAIDLQEILTEKPSRPTKGITENLLRSMNCLGKKAGRRKRVRILIALAIPWQEYKHEWNHPVHGEKNKKICTYLERTYGKGCVPGEEQEGCIDLAEVLTRQFLDLGIPIENIKLLRTVDSLSYFGGPDGKEAWYSTRGSFRDRRNLVLVTRYS